MLPAEFRAVRHSLGLTQHAMAEAMGMGKWGWQTISAWEGGKKPITARTAAQVRAMVRE